ncbi:hypothetical protein [Taibaiella koreensis]|nr:hypothetical protein [Taibaiella koreensis]
MGAIITAMSKIIDYSVDVVAVKIGLKTAIKNKKAAVATVAFLDAIIL